MPSKFTDFGANIISGLVNGIRNAWEGAKKVVGELGDNIKGWFAEKLGIHSPSRVFASFGDNISQGAAIGISRTTPLAVKAGQRLAGALTPDVPDIPIPLLNADGSVRRSSANSAPPNGASNGIHVTFSPNIYLNGQKTPATTEITSALNLSLHELEKMMERIVAQQQRRGYA